MRIDGKGREGREEERREGGKEERMRIYGRGRWEGEGEQSKGGEEEKRKEE